MKQQKTTWILVCDASRAQLFADSPRHRAYVLVRSFDHPMSRAHITEIATDAQGRKPVGGSRGNGVNGRAGAFYGRPGAEPETDPKEVEAQKFARELAAELKKGLDEHAYDALVLAAPPHFLGLLRDALDEQVMKRVESTMDKDLSSFEPREIEQRMRAARAG